MEINGGTAQTDGVQTLTLSNRRAIIEPDGTATNVKFQLVGGVGGAASATSWQNPDDGPRTSERLALSKLINDGRLEGSVVLTLEILSEAEDAFYSLYGGLSGTWQLENIADEWHFAFYWNDADGIVQENVVRSSGAPSVKGIHQLCFTWDASGTYVYVDGVLEGSGAVPFLYSILNSTPEWQADGGLRLAVIEETHLSKRLNDQEVTSLYDDNLMNYPLDSYVIAQYRVGESMDRHYSERFDITLDPSTGAFLVDKDGWAFGGAEYLEIPRAGWANFNAEDSGGFYVGFNVPENGNIKRPVTTREATGNKSGLKLYIVDDVVVGYAKDQNSVQDTVSFENVSLDGYRVAGLEIDRNTNELRLFFDGSVKTIDIPVGSTFVGTTPVRIGYDESVGTNPFVGDSEVYWVAFFRRVLTQSERDALAAWDGSVANEPVWLRPLAVFYINANDPAMKEAYNG